MKGLPTGEESCDDDDDEDDSFDSGLRAKRADEAGYFDGCDDLSSDDDRDPSTPPRKRCLERISVPPMASPEGAFETSVVVFTTEIEVDITAYGYAQGAEMDGGQ